MRPLASRAQAEPGGRRSPGEKCGLAISAHAVAPVSTARRHLDDERHEPRTPWWWLIRERVSGPAAGRIHLRTCEPAQVPAAAFYEPRCSWSDSGFPIPARRFKAAQAGCLGQEKIELNSTFRPGVLNAAMQPALPCAAIRILDEPPSTKEAYEALQSRINTEQGLLSNRMGWLMTTQGFLLTPFAISYGQHWGGPDEFRLVLALIGTGTCGILTVAITAAVHTLDRVIQRRGRLFDTCLNSASGPNVHDRPDARADEFLGWVELNRNRAFLRLQNRLQLLVPWLLLLAWGCLFFSLRTPWQWKVLYAAMVLIPATPLGYYFIYLGTKAKKRPLVRFDTVRRVPSIKPARAD